MQVKSLKRRLCLSFIPLLVIMVALVAWVAHWEMEEILYTHVDHIVQARCHGLVSILSAVSEGSEQTRLIDELVGNGEGEDQTLYWLWDTDQRRVLMTNTTHEGSSLPWMAKATRDARSPLASGTGFNGDIKGAEYRVMQQSTFLGQGAHLLFVAYPSQSLHDQLHHFLWYLFGLATLVVLVAIALAVGAVYWALRPVNLAAGLLRSIAWSDTRMADIDRLNVPSELMAFKEALKGMLNRLDQFVDKQKQFTSNAAHELRTPLTLAKSTVQTAFYQMDRSEDHCQQAMTDILGDLNRMAGLIDQLQMLSNLDETEDLSDTEVLSVDGLLQDVIQSYSHTPPGRVSGVSIHPVSVQGNRDLLHCLLTNLIDNALKHGPVDRPVHVHMQPGSDEASVCVQIKDEGGAIPQEELSRLTERFYRVDVSRGRDTGGSGLGLAIAHEIVKKHRGQLTIESSPGAGTCVLVRLPIVN
ncbi:MAG: hypothetical protein GY809_22475 [Planctomycetes bacterium]|nr:hypothetical protein [Planctomycetota bacterium]